MVDTLAVHALRTERAALEAAMDTLPPDIRLGVALVRGRSGLPIADANRKVIFKHLAQIALTKEARVYLDIVVAKDDTHETAFVLNGHELLPQLAARFVAGDEAWGKAVAAGLARGTWETVAQVDAGLRRVPLETLVTRVGKRSNLDRDPGALFALLDARKDSDTAVLTIARALPSGYAAGSVRELRELLLVWALAQRAARGEPVRLDDAKEHPAQRRELLLTKLQCATYVDRPYRFVPSEESRDFRTAATQILIRRAAPLTTDDNFDFAVPPCSTARAGPWVSPCGPRTTKATWD